MAHVNEKIAFLRDYINNKDQYLPLIDHAWKTFEGRAECGEVNVGWGVGLIDAKRPYFCECWAEGVTVITYFVSTIGIEDYSVKQLEEMLEKHGIIRYVGKRKYDTFVKRFWDGFGNEFFSINIIVGDDDDTYIEGGIIYPIERLNEFNMERQKKAE